MQKSMKQFRVPSLLLLNQPAVDYEVPLFEKGDRIPKIIHQTYHSTVLPQELAENIAALKAMNPGWEFRLYDDHDIEKFIAENYGDKILAVYHRINPHYGAARADFFRYLLIYRVGGVYLDIKSTAIRPLDEVILPDDQLILSHWGAKFSPAGRHPQDFRNEIEEGEYQQWHIMSIPGHHYIRQVIQFVMRNIDHYIPSVHGRGKHGVLRVTGPIAYTLAVHPLLPMKKHRLVRCHEDIGLVYSIFKGREHHRLFKKNYRTLTEPVVQARLPRQILSALHDRFDYVRRVLAKVS